MYSCRSSPEPAVRQIFQGRHPDSECWRLRDWRVRLPPEPLSHGPGEPPGLQRRLQRPADVRGHPGPGLDLTRAFLLTWPDLTWPELTWPDKLCPYQAVRALLIINHSPLFSLHNQSMFNIQSQRGIKGWKLKHWNASSDSPPPLGRIME